MSIEKDKSGIFKILYIYEDAINENKEVSEHDYLTYLDRLYIKYLGKDNEEIYATLKGLHKLGIKASHKSVKSVVFHLIDLLEKGG